ncbi:MAG: excinuclease ABC subunit UvrA, partial [Muribaculaceae bacterium]|nr:excinuclease ABC subunit UvrA [Muribaculaceae bacterium]
HIHRPYCDLTEEEIDYLWNGSEASVNAFFDMLRKSAYKIQNRTMLARFRGETVCPQCRGNRLKKEAEYVKVGGLSITDIVRMPVEKVLEFFRQLTLSEEDATIAKRPLEEICSRLQFMCDVGLSYLTLNRLSSTLSGGESQRINLAKSLGSTLVGSVYILDEPSIGLHSRDTSRLLKVLRMLQRLDNTVVVVEHDEEIIKEADYLIDIGPAAGRKGGEVVFAGNYSTIDQAQNSLTANYLLGKNKIPVPTVRRKSSIYIEVLGARENNLKNIDVRFPLNVMTVVTGVSGSGKSTLVTNILYRALTRHFMGNDGAPGTHKGLGGDLRLLHGVQLVDQSSIVKNRSSNPAIYIKAFAEIRKLYADQQLSKQMGYREGFFSFNSEGGCEECGGQGHIEVQMQFMADLVLECESCHGKRYNKSALEVEYRGKNISDVLNMTVNQAIEFFSESNGTTERRIVKRLQPLQDVGLGYIMLGQSSATLSGGENQRLKLAYYLSMESDEPTMFIFDEPTTGLHFHDINTLLKAFYRLIEHGHTVVIIEHNMDVIKCADHIIDMGPEGGSAGGNVVVCGTPEQVSECEESFTGRWLRSKLL